MNTNENMTSVYVPATADLMRVWIKNDMDSAMDAETSRVAAWLLWIESGNWTLDNIAAMVADVGVAGREHGKVMDRDTFKNYCNSLTLVSKQLGENPTRIFTGRLDRGITEPEKKKDKKGFSLVAFKTRFEGKGSRKPLYSVAVIHTKEAKRIEKPLDHDDMPDDLTGFVEETSELSLEQQAARDAAQKAYSDAKLLEIANLALLNVSYDPAGDFGDSLHAPMDKGLAWQMHMARVSGLLAAKDREIERLNALLAAKPVRKTKV